MDSLLGQAPLFPLPGGALLPHELLPLHVFEPRYRRMLEVARQADRIIAIATLLPGFDGDEAGRPPVAHIVGVGRIVRDRQNPDGTSDIALHGLMRGEIENELEGGEEPFRRAAIRLHPEARRHPTEDFRLTRRLLTGLAACADTASLRFDLTAEIAVGPLVDRIAGHLELRPAQRVAVLQALEIDGRVERLLAILREKKHRRTLLRLLPSLEAFTIGLDSPRGRRQDPPA